MLLDQSHADWPVSVDWYTSTLRVCLSLTYFFLFSFSFFFFLFLFICRCHFPAALKSNTILVLNPRTLICFFAFLTRVSTLIYYLPYWAKLRLAYFPICAKKWASVCMCLSQRELETREESWKIPILVTRYHFLYLLFLGFFVHLSSFLWFVSYCSFIYQLDLALNAPHEDSEVHLLRTVVSLLRVLVIYDEKDNTGRVNFLSFFSPLLFFSYLVNINAH
jgi:hypothetical protein